MNKYVYLALCFTALTIPLLLSIIKWRNVYTKPKIWLVFVLVALPFIIWDIYATAYGHWAFNPYYTIGIKLFGLPLEELLFFFAIPFACLYVWEWLKKRTANHKICHKKQLIMLAFIILFSIILLILGGTYSWIVAITLLLSNFYFFGKGWFGHKRFWYFQLIIFSLFFIFNSLLTTLPIVTYNPHFIVGIRIGSIPLEDFAYNFVLINMSLAVYDLPKVDIIKK